jgi:hypothetical protein
MYRIKSILTAIILTTALIASSGSGLVTEHVKALDVLNRSLTINSATSSANTFHLIKFNFQTNNSVGSLKFEYCDSPLELVPCVAPAGLDVSAASFASQSGETGFSVFSQTSNVFILSRTASVTGNQLNTYRFNNVTNPSSIGSFYLRISSFSSTDGTGSSLDFGGTVGVITKGVTITTEVPPILNFCVGVTIPTNCASASGTQVELGNFTKNQTSYGTSQFIVGTNASFGYVVRANGNTMTSGNNTIKAITSPTTSNIGTSQFGINLRANSSPPVGKNPAGGTGIPTASYNSPNHFKFTSGNIITSGATSSTNERYTVSYIVNINSSQPVGVYNTTITYLVTGSF